MVASSEPDGYTLMFSTPGPVVVSPLINRNAGYDTLKNFAPVAIVSQSPLLLVIHPSVPAKTVKELVAYAKANPGKVHFPSPGFGTQPHLVGEMFKSMTGLDIVHVPYRGSAPAITDLLAGQMQIYFDNFANVLQHVESGKLRAHRGHRRRAQPAIAGRAPPWTRAALAASPRPIGTACWRRPELRRRSSRRLNAAVNQALAAPEVRAALKKLGSDPKSGTSQEFAAFIAAEVQRWGKVVRDANIKVD